MWTRILERIGSPSGPALLFALAVLLSAQSLFFGLQTDDHMHGRSFADGVGAWELLQLPAPTVEAKRQVGEFSWWTRTWLVWLGRRPARWQPPQRGERLSLAPVSPLDLDGVRE